MLYFILSFEYAQLKIIPLAITTRIWTYGTLSYPTSDLKRSRFRSMFLRSCPSMARTVETGNWNASSHEPKVCGSGASAAMKRDFSGVVKVDGIRRQTII